MQRDIRTEHQTIKNQPKTKRFHLRRALRQFKQKKAEGNLQNFEGLQIKLSCLAKQYHEP